MKFSIGDKVVLKQTGEEGNITAYINKEMIEVEVNGTTFPVYIEEIDHPYLKWFTEKKVVAKKTFIPEQLPVEKQKLRPKRLAKGVYLSFLPVFKQDEMEDIVDVLKVHLLNELPVSVKFSYDVRINHRSLFRHEGTLHPFGHLYLHSVSWADMDEQPRFHWSLADVANNDLQIEDGVLKIGTAKLFRHINELMLKNEPTFSYMLIEDFSVKKAEEPKEKFIPKPKEYYVNQSAGLSVEAPKYVLDLHIEKIVDDITGMDNADMLHLQMRTLERYINLAIIHDQERMVVIHGLGKGVLRFSIHDYLSKSQYVDKYVNEYNPKYGFGATEIFFKR